MEQELLDKCLVQMKDQNSSVLSYNKEMKKLLKDIQEIKIPDKYSVEEVRMVRNFIRLEKRERSKNHDKMD